VALSEISCEEVLSEIEHYLHGELDQVKSVQLAEHLLWRVRMAIRTTRFPDREGPPGTL